jgi:two-component system, cell cycle response regulator DivK
MSATTRHVLVVEDDERSRRLAREVLDLAGFHVLTATTGAEGIEVAIQERPDLILMDVGLPDMDGAVALTRLRAATATASIPVVALTALAMKGERERLLSAGFDDYLSKPIDVDALVEVALAHTDHPRGA